MASNSAGWRVAIGLGSNMPGDQGSPEAMIRAAASAVLDLPGTQLLAASQVYATPPWGVVTQDGERTCEYPGRSHGHGKDDITFVAME